MIVVTFRCSAALFSPLPSQLNTLNASIISITGTLVVDSSVFFRVHLVDYVLLLNLIANDSAQLLGG
jgi:hypothetical protein